MPPVNVTGEHELERERYRNQCVQAAIIEGVKYGSMGLAAGVVGVALLSQQLKGFQRLNMSARTAVVRRPSGDAQ